MNWVRVLVVAIAVSLPGACAWMFIDLKAPKVTLASIEPLQLGLFEQRFNLRLRIQNAGDVELPIRGMACALQLNGADFAQGVSDQEITVPGYGEAVIDVHVVANLATLLRQAARLEGDHLRYRLFGTLGLMNRAFRLPFDYEGEADFDF